MLKSVLLGLVVGGLGWLAFKDVQESVTYSKVKNPNNQIGRSFVTTTGEAIVLKEDESGRVYDNVGRLWV